MFGVTKKSDKPTTYYAIAFCVHVVAFVLMAIGMFTPYWSEITEGETKNSPTYTKYNKGLLVSCSPTIVCQANVQLTSASKVFFAAFVIGIISIIFAFFILQLFGAGIFIRSCKEKNLGVPIAAMSIAEGVLLLLTLVFFEISIGKDSTSGFIHRDDTFGFSRGIIIGAVVLYWIAAFFIIGEYFRRKPTDLMPPYDMNKPTRRPPGRNYRNDYDRGRNRRQPQVMAPVAPPPYTTSNPVFQRNKAASDPLNDGYQRGMSSCNRPGCQMCNYVAESSTFWGPAGVFNITERLNCTNHNVVYAILCMKDEKVFIGHSVLKLEDTFRVHLANIRANNMSDSVAEHFAQLGHNPQDMRISTLATINCEDEVRARLEKALSYKMDQPHNSYYGINEDFQFL